MLSSEKPGVEVREDRVKLLEFSQFPGIHPALAKTLLQLAEAPQMELGAPDRVGHEGAGAHDERPVARLGQEQLAPGLRQRPFLKGVVAVSRLSEKLHALRGMIQMPVDPIVRRIEPHRRVASLPPARRMKVSRAGTRDPIDRLDRIDDLDLRMALGLLEDVPPTLGPLV